MTKMFLTTLTTLALVTPASAASPPLGFKTTCTEAKPCWSWYTLSDNERNVVVGDHKVIRVRPCTFAWLDYAGYINWRHTRHRRGDGIARAHGCDPRFYPPSSSTEATA